MKAHFVEFFSPGTFVAETSVKPIPSWDVQAALELSKGVEERYGARPYGFRFLTKQRGDGDLDSHISKSSGMYYIDGQVLSLADLQAKGDPDDSTLIENMRCNEYSHVVRTCSPYKWAQPLGEGDVVLDAKGRPLQEQPNE
jgi:hypothetical protein